MTEIGESVAVATPAKDEAEEEKSGNVKVTVVNQCKGSDDQPVEIADATVRVGTAEKPSDGTASSSR